MKIKEKKIQLGWISGMPRSGTTWLSQIFASCPDVRMKFCPLFSYDFKNILDENSTAKQWDKLFTDVYHTNSEFLDQDYLRKDGLVPTFTQKNKNPNHLFIKSTRFHNLVPYLLELNREIRFVHIVRHPCASVYSWLSNPLEFPEYADPHLEWRTGKCRKTGPGEFWGFNDWMRVTRQALFLSEQYPDRHRIIRYEDLVGNPQGQTKEIFAYFEIPYEKQTQEFLENTHSRHDDSRRSVFKNPKVIDRWQQKLDPTIVAACLNEIKGSALEQFVKN
jgi:hypothetical protein